MAFQFLCPQNHLLEGDESQMGQPCQCPVCGMMFLVPVVGPAAAAPMMPGYGGPPGYPPGMGQYAQQPPGYGGYAAPPSYAPAAEMAPVAPPPEPEPASAPAGETAEAEAPTADAPEGTAPEGGEAATEPPPELKPEDDPNRLVHIPCPHGHALETPMSMVGAEALCPQCGVQFLLRYEDSLEYKEEQQRREELFNKRLLIWSIGIAIVVGIGLISLVVAAVM